MQLMFDKPAHKRNGTGEISLNNFDVSGVLFQPGPEAFLPRTNTVSLSEGSRIS
jgi:hypothetical protein